MCIKQFIISTQYINGNILEFEYKSETEHFLIEESGARTKKMSSSQEHYNTWKEAKDRLIELQYSKVARLQTQYNREKDTLQKIKQLKEPKEI